MTEKEISPECASPDLALEPVVDISPSEYTGSNSLERIVDITDEMTHLNQLVLMHLEKRGGFTTTEAYFDIVQPLLDLLEVEIGVRYHPGMTTTEMKLVVQDWIDGEIADLRKGC